MKVRKEQSECEIECDFIQTNVSMSLCASGACDFVPRIVLQRRTVWLFVPRIVTGALAERLCGLNEIHYYH